MSKNIMLTIDEIHAIRAEHYEKTKDMSFDDYKKSLNDEIAPILLILNQKKSEKSKKIEQ